MTLSIDGLLRFGDGKWLLTNRLPDASAANALNADANRLRLTTGQRRFDRLKIGLEATASDASDLGTDPTQVFRLPSGLHRIANTSRLVADRTDFRHR